MTVKDSQQLKQLQTRKAKLEVDIKELKKDISDSQQRCITAGNQLMKVNEEISSLQVKDVVVTEHAIIRYLERVMGLDLDQLKSEILSDSLKHQVKAMGNGKYPIGNGVKIVVKDNAVVSVI